MGQITSVRVHLRLKGGRKVGCQEVNTQPLAINRNLAERATCLKVILAHG